MDNAVYSPPFTKHVAETGVLGEAPFVLIDVGCGMGIDSLWRVFEPHLVAHGFDAQTDEIDRLTQAETNLRIRYHASLVGLPPDHEFHKAREREGKAPYFDPISRSSAFAATAREAKRGRRSLKELNSWRTEALTTDKISLTEFLRNTGLATVDFVKLDTDGSDYEVLLSAEDAIREHDILGFMVETAFNAPPTPTANAFHNIDLFLRRHGFLLLTMSVNRYSRETLPAPFTFRVLAQTTFGQVMWGDTVYLRDAGSPVYGEVWGSELAPTKLLKLACLCELFAAPDVAIELILRHKRKLKRLLDTETALNLLTPPLPDGRVVPYREYVAAFKADPYSFYPPSESELEINGAESAEVR